MKTETKKYSFNEGVIEIPAEWQDKTIHILTASKDDTAGLSLTISRDRKPWGMKFSEFAKREINSIGKQLTGYQHINSMAGKLADKETVEEEFEWDSTQGHIHQLMTFIDSEPLVLMITATMNGQLSAGQKEKVQQLIQTLSFWESDQHD